MPDQQQAHTDEELAAGIAAATGVDMIRARFMLGLQRGDTSGDVVVVGGIHADPPMVELSSAAATIVHTEAGAVVAYVGKPYAGNPLLTQFLWRPNGQQLVG